MNKRLAKKLELKRKNNDAMERIRREVLTHITRQGGGCYTRGGVAYVNHTKGTSDPIGCLAFYGDLKRHYGPIGEDAQLPLVHKIMGYYGMPKDPQSEVVRFIDFLTKLQDAHDEAFNPFAYKVPENPLNYFISVCENVRIQ